MKRVVFLLLMLSALIFIGSCNSNHTDPHTEGLEFAMIREGECQVSAGTAIDQSEIVIPATYQGMTVTKIANYAFNYCENLTKIIIPDSVTEIGEHAFRKCTSLTEINLPSSVKKIEKNAFEHCSTFDTIVLPANIEYLRSGLFFGSHVNTLVIQDASTLKYVSASALNDGVGRVLVLDGSFNDSSFHIDWDKDAKIFYNVKAYNKTSPDNTFKYFEIGQHEDNRYDAGAIIYEIIVNEENQGCITFPKSIGDLPVSCLDFTLQAYSDSIKAVKIPADLDKKLYNFYNMKLDYVDCILVENEAERLADNPRVVPNCHSFGYDKDTGFLWASLTSKPDYIKIIGYYGNETEELKIPDSIDKRIVLEIANEAFYKSQVKKIILPSDLTLLDSGAFQASELEEIIFGGKLETIAESAFYLCTKLKSISLPSSTKSIGDNAFYGCSSLTSVTLNQGLESIGESVFHLCSFTSITIPKSVLVIKKYALRKGELQNNGDDLRVPDGYVYTVYCEAEEKPEGWEDLWDVFYTNVNGHTLARTHAYIKDYGSLVWGYTE